MTKVNFIVYNNYSFFFLATNCPTLKTCLMEMRNWSDSHPYHYPLMIFLEGKQTYFSTSKWDDLDAVLTSAFPRTRIIAPDDIRKSAVNLRTAINNNPTAWPTVESSRGKVMFALLGDNGNYSAGANANLVGRISFRVLDVVNGTNNDAAIFSTNVGFLTDGVLASQLVNASFLVRARADADFLPGASDKNISEIYAQYFVVMDRDNNGYVSLPEILGLLNAVGTPADVNLLTNVLVGLCRANLTIGATYNNFECTIKTGMQFGYNLIPPPASFVTVVAQRAAVFRSGAQFIATDYPFPPFQGADPSTSYWVDIPNTNSTIPVACHPFFQRTGCQSSWIEPGPEPALPTSVSTASTASIASTASTMASSSSSSTTTDMDGGSSSSVASVMSTVTFLLFAMFTIFL